MPRGKALVYSATRAGFELKRVVVHRDCCACFKTDHIDNGIGHQPLTDVMFTDLPSGLGTIVPQPAPTQNVSFRTNGVPVKSTFAAPSPHPQAIAWPYGVCVKLFHPVMMPLENGLSEQAVGGEPIAHSLRISSARDGLVAYSPM